MMNNLLQKSPAMPKEGQIVKGTVIEVGKNTVFVDLGPIGTGVILGREVKDNQQTIKGLKPDDEIYAMVLELENENGLVELSLKAANKQTAWEELAEVMQKRETVSTKIAKANKGGLMIELKGISGFLPVSQLSYEHYPRIDDGDKTKILNELNKFVGKELSVKIIDLDAPTQKLIVSEKALQEQTLKETLKTFKVSDVVEGSISGVVDFGAFVKIHPHTLNKKSDAGETKENWQTGQTKEIQNDDKGVGVDMLKPTIEDEKQPEIIEGLIHISEIDWQLIEDPRQILKVGQNVTAKIIGIENDKLSLSLKALKTDPWLEIDQKYQKGQIIHGQVTKFNPFGAFVQLDKDIHGLAHISEFGSDQNMKSQLEIGKEYDFKILSIEPRQHKMALSLIRPETQKIEE